MSSVKRSENYTEAARAEAKAYTFYTSAEYYPELARRVNATVSGDRITLVTLWLRNEQPAIEAIVTALCSAAERGVRIILLIDAFHFLIKEGMTPGPAFFFGSGIGKLPGRFKRRQNVIDRLRDAGVHCQVINQTSRPFMNPFKGRSHIKYAVVNDTVFVGGCNLSEAHFLDVMVSWQDTQIAGQLHELGQGIMRTGNVSKALSGVDQSIVVDGTTTLLLDAGTRNQSVILDRAHAIIEAAESELLITYQHFPNGPTVERLQQAVARGVRLRVFYNHPSKHKPPLNIVYALGARPARRSGLVELSEHRLPPDHPYVHAKVLTSEKVGMVSSHNYMTAGVELGTAEIGLVSTDPAFIRKLNETILRQLG